MDIQEFENKAVQTYRHEGDLITYVLEYIDAKNGYSIRSYDDRFKGLSDYDGDFLGTTPDNGNNVAMMAWEYNAVPVREI
ncbi:hypothetical protein [Leuconostoc mesenteroides]|uniref:hypothetical protein n=1 Tax=Leuconostoc mesenteroides TaxID=1245 RepID=UPI00235F3192|nr:hypothetical protein [Leuconostoc mesenteroides]